VSGVTLSERHGAIEYDDRPCHNEIGCRAKGDFRMGWMPEPRSSRWWGMAGASSAIVTILLWLIRFVIADQSFAFNYAFRYMLLAVILSLMLGLMGWLGLRRLWLCGSAGIALGLLMMALSSGGNSGWEDLISLLNFFMMTGLGVAAGALLDLLAWVYGAWSRKSK